MKRAILITCLTFVVTGAIAQAQQGTIIYERTIQLQVQINDPAFQNSVPRERKEKFELLYAGNKTLWRPMEEDAPQPELQMNDGAGAEIRIVVPGSNDVTYCDIEQQYKVEKKEIFSKEFVVEDSIRKMSWKIGNDSKDILGYNCKMATTQRIQTATKVNMDNGKMAREEFQDTATIVAWFTDAIPGFGGPDIYQGQLPGTILEVDVNNGRSHFLAQQVSPKVDVKEIREPKGKKISPQEFAKEKDKMFKQMQENNGGNVNIKIGH